MRITIASITNKKKATDQLENIIQRLGQPNDAIYQNNPQRPAIYQLKKSIKNLALQRREAENKRHQHLTFRQEVLVLEGKIERAKALKTIRRAEQRSRCFKKFQAITRPTRTAGGIAFVLSPNPNGMYTRIQQPAELESSLFHRNRRHFSQADGTPFTRPHLSTALGFSGVNNAGDDILNGI
jgi:hypothetical protein